MDLDIGWSRADLEGDSVKAQDAQTTIQENYVKADIYYQTLNVRAIKEEKKYSVRKRPEVRVRRIELIDLRHKITLVR